MLTIGLTGGIGSGKTAVSDIFRKLGVPVIDTDQIARKLLSRDSNTLQGILQLFGNAVRAPDGSLNRRALAKLIFSQPAAKTALEKHLHPLIRERVSSQLDLLRHQHQPPYVIVVVPLLFEAGFDDMVDQVIVVDADENTRLARIRQRDKQRSEAEIRQILASQLDSAQRIARADELVVNNAGLNELENRVRSLHKYYSTLHHSPQKQD